MRLNSDPEVGLTKSQISTPMKAETMISGESADQIAHGLSAGLCGSSTLRRQTTRDSTMKTIGWAPSAMIDFIASILPERIMTRPSRPRTAPHERLGLDARIDIVAGREHA